MKQLIIPLILMLIFATLIVAQDDDSDDTALWLSVAGATCPLELIELDSEATPEATPETTPEPSADNSDWLPDLPTYTLSDDCDDVERLLVVASKETGEENEVKNEKGQTGSS
jgi:hypothetical protein